MDANQLNTVNIFDSEEIEKQIKIFDSVDSCIEDEIVKTKSKLKGLIKQQNKLRTSKENIKIFSEVLKVL